MGRTIDLTGQRFGKLLVIKKDESVAPKNGRHTKWICQCDCGNIISVQSNHLRAGEATACSQACKTRIPNGSQFGKLTVIEMTNERAKNGGSVLYKCQCDCGNIELVSSTELRANRKFHCLKCGFSAGEIIITKILQKNNICYEQEYIAPGCINPKTKKPLRFDFYLPDYNCFIEFDGVQHFEIINYWGGEQGLQERQERDNIKTNYCFTNKVYLIRIPYTVNLNNLLLEDLLPKTSKFLVSELTIDEDWEV